MLFMAFLGFGINFWAWALLTPLGPKNIQTGLGLSNFTEAWVVAIPVVVGSIGRIPIGALTDRYGGRVMFPIVSFVTIIPILVLAFAGEHNLTVLFIAGFFLGISGTTFAVGIPYVNAWFPPAKRGLAVGLFGVGMGGTAISALTTLKFANGFQGLKTPTAAQLQNWASVWTPAPGACSASNRGACVPILDPATGMPKIDPTTGKASPNATAFLHNFIVSPSWKMPFIICAIALAVYGILAWLIMRDAPNRPLPKESLGTRMAWTLKMPITWLGSAMYAIGFGGYVAFSVYLPTYLNKGYGIVPQDAANKLAIFVIIAVIMRPIGGWLSDRFDGARVTAVAFFIAAVCAYIQSTGPGGNLVKAGFNMNDAAVPGVGTAIFLILAAALGITCGAVFALVAQRTEVAKVGSVTGVVGAAGGLGGFIPPLMMGGFYDGKTGASYSIGFLLLGIMATLVFIQSLAMMRRRAPAKAAAA
ncbi:MAG: MFS transporter [Actinomycetia bacterium]|nr:MFS transporter [Actinomycetes bacterium]